MQKIMSGIRVVAVKVSGTVSNKLHLQEAAQRIFESKDRLAEVVKASKGTTLNYDINNDQITREILVRSPNQKPYLSLGFKTQNGKEFVKYLKVLDLQTLNENKKELDVIMSKFNRTARSALKRAIQKPKVNFYTDSVDLEVNQTKIEFKDYAVMVRKRIELRKQSQFETNRVAKSCSHLFQ